MGIDINISGATKLVGLVGSPVEHSMSPVMHSDSFQKMGVNAVYTAFDVTPDKLADVRNGCGWLQRNDALQNMRWSVP